MDTEAAVVSLTGPRLTEGYTPSIYIPPSRWRDHGAIFPDYDLEEMRRDPRIQLGLGVLKGPVYTARISVSSPRPEVQEWVFRQYEHLWETELGLLLLMLDYGVATGEVTLRDDPKTGLAEIQSLHHVRYSDAKPLQWDGGAFAGIRVKRIKSHSDSNIFVPSPRAYWIANEPEFNPYSGRSRLWGAWEPWKEKSSRHGGKDCRRTWYLRNAFSGIVIRHPPGKIKLGDGREMSNQDYAREIAESYENGGVLILPSARDENSKEFLWSVEWPKVNGDIGGMRDYIKDLDDEIFQGMRILKEVIEAAESGSGWAGRTVPFLVYLTDIDRVVKSIVSAIDEQVIKPVAQRNFGIDVEYSVKPISLVPQDKPDGAKDPGGMAGGLGGQGGQDSSPNSGGQQYVGPRGGRGFRGPDGKIRYEHAQLSHERGIPEVEDDPPVNDDFGATAAWYASLLTLLQEAGSDTEFLVDSAYEELADSGWYVFLAEDGTWHASQDAEGQAVQLSHVRAPIGGITIQGKQYRGGWFIPSAQVADVEQKAAAGDPAAQADLQKIEATKAGHAIKSQARVTQRQARGSVSANDVRGKLAPFAEIPLTPTDKRQAGQAWRMYQRHHGELALHRLDEVADDLQNALNKIGDDHPNSDGLREQFSRRLRQLHDMVGLAEASGVSGQVQAPAKPAEQPAIPPVTEQPAAQPQEAPKAATATTAPTTATAPQPAPAAHDTARNLISKHLTASKLPEATRKAYESHAHEVLGAMPAKALERFNTHAKAYEFYDNSKELNAGLGALSEKAKKAIEGGLVVGGAWERKAGKLHMDGASEKQSASDIYSHEMSHAVDGPQHELSSSPEWKAAFASEIKGGGLSKYATQNEIEGFAEFGRLVYGNKTAADELRKKYPLSTAYWESQGLIPEASKAPLQPLAEVFEGAAIEDAGTHVDPLKQPKGAGVGEKGEAPAQGGKAKEPHEMTRNEFQFHPEVLKAKDSDTVVQGVGLQGNRQAVFDLRKQVFDEEHAKKNLNEPLRNKEVGDMLNRLRSKRPSKAQQEAIKTLEAKQFDHRDTHRKVVEAALASGKPVPESVLADYPDLAKKPTPQPQQAPKAPAAEAKPAVAPKPDKPASKTKPAAAPKAAARPPHVERAATLDDSLSLAGSKGASIPDLFKQAKAKDPSVTRGEFHDSLRRLEAAGKVAFEAHTGPIFDLANPEDSFLSEDGKIATKVKQGSGTVTGRKAAVAPSVVDKPRLIEDIKKITHDYKAKNPADVEVGKIFDDLKAAHPELTIGQFQDTLREINESKDYRLSTWSGPIFDIPKKEHVVFIGHRPGYYLRPSEGSQRPAGPVSSASAKSAEQQAEASAEKPTSKPKEPPAKKSLPAEAAPKSHAEREAAVKALHARSHDAKGISDTEIDSALESLDESSLAEVRQTAKELGALQVGKTRKDALAAVRRKLTETNRARQHIQV